MPDSQKPSYFLIAVSNRENLDLCIRYGLAGFPGGESGVWTFCEVRVGDFLSFLYGAKAHNLYRVAKKEAILDAESLPPWKPLEFTESGKKYSFPFRLKLEPVRSFTEALVRAEFSYVAENLLLRGGYSKSHFQADQTTLQSVSEMGRLADTPPTQLDLPPHATFVPRFTKNRHLLHPPTVMRFKETILQAAVRQHLAVQPNVEKLRSTLHLRDTTATEFEVLGEKALPEGHVDILLKERTPIGSATKIPIEVKTNVAKEADVNQVSGYVEELRGECPTGILLAAGFAKKVPARAAAAGIELVRYILDVDLTKTPAFEDICAGLTLEPS